MDGLKKIAQLRDALNNIYTHAETLKSFFGEPETVDLAELLLSPKILEDFNITFTMWAKESMKCRELWQEIFNTPMPKTFAELKESLSAQEKKIVEQSVFGRAEKFLSFVSTNPDLKKDLLKHQVTLSKLLKPKKFDSKTKAAVEPYAKFIEAFEETNLGKKFSAAKKISDFFGDDFIGTAFFDGNLILSPQIPLPLPDDDTASPKPKNKSDSAPPPEKIESKSFVEILHEKGAFLTDAELAPWQEKFKVEFEPNRKINARNVRDLFKPPLLFNEKRCIFEAAINEPCFSLGLFEYDKKFKTENLTGTVQILYSKGYLKHYTLSGRGEFYGKTEDFLDFMKDDKGKTFEKIFSTITSKKVTLDWAKNLEAKELREDTLQIVLAHIMPVRLRALAKEQKIPPQLFRLLDESFLAGFKVSDKFDLFVGCFWDAPDEAEIFLQAFVKYIDIHDKYIDEHNKIDRVIAMGLNVAHAEKILDALQIALPEKFPKDAELLVYSFDEDVFYRKGTTEKFSLTELWAQNTDETPPDEPAPDKAPVDETSADETVTDKTAGKTSRKKNSADKTVAKKITGKKTSRKKTVAVEISGDEPVESADDKPVAVKPVPDENSVVETVPDDFAIVNEMIAAKKFYCATAYLKALSLQDNTWLPIYLPLAYALNDPLLGMSYSAEKIISLMDGSATLNETCLTAATLRTFFYNDKPYDYDMKNLHGMIKNFELVGTNTPLSDLIFALMNFKDKAHNGADYYADYRVKNLQQTETKIVRLRAEAQTCIARLKNTSDKAYNPRFIETKKILFGSGSELVDYLEFIAEDQIDAEISAKLKTYLAEKFIREEAPLSVANLDGFKLDNIIAEAWEAAGNNISQKKKNNMLVGELKNNVVTSFKKAIEILCEHVKLFEETTQLHADGGVVEYQKIRNKLIANAKAAQKKLTKEHVAWHGVLIATLQEIIDKLEGTFEPERQKYFYADFLRGTEILLDENYFPILTFNTLDGTSNGITERIIAHARAKLPTFEKRIENIFLNAKKDGDFGTAQLIDAYLEKFGEGSFIETRKVKLQAGIDAMQKIALNEKKKFFGFMELAQSYGQFDNAPMNTKENILKLIDRCFEFAGKLNNFGVFFRVKTYWENKTRSDAAAYAAILEKNLQLGIDNYCRKTNELPDAPAVKRTVAQIRKMIERQNYTVAQGLINRLGDGKLYSATQETGTTHLQRFIKDYEDYYERVSKASDSFQNLVDKNKRFSYAKTSKAIKGGELLVDSWIPNGFPTSGDVGTEKIARLLNLLGFKVETVERIGALKKDALTYKVKLLRPSNGQTSNYSHPIPAFGSKAEVNGFRVTCLFGKYDADGLIERFKALGNADDTLILLDYALTLPTRRSLARKIKAESSITKIFAVVDRVLMMYLIKNYDELQINKILMSLTMPFAACQPYVFNPNVQIPPEVFIGREKEMRRVLDFDDVNLVYGGRQLGKTALLKMACASLDRNENNDRAIFVDVNKCDCASAALKICKDLRDKNFFDKNVPDINDWATLTDEIKKRLASSKPNKIPHFLLALDESDDFLKSCRNEGFAPILQLIDLQQNPPEGTRFKFVMAGLRDVVRFYRDEALGNNGQFAKLPSLVVRPFDFDEANELLREPLRCLGFYFSVDSKTADSLALMILETTNYFPGLIQHYCAKLIEALSRKDYAGYSETAAPIYQISDNHVQSVLSEESFNAEIKTKIQMTLRLGDDKFYYVIANLMAWRYHNDDSSEGYSAEDILFTAKEYGLQKLLPADVKQVEALLKELCELNILRETVKGKYLFVRQRFLNIIGTLKEIETEISNGFGEN